jgi:hypothetical protein
VGFLSLIPQVVDPAAVDPPGASLWPLVWLSASEMRIFESPLAFRRPSTWGRILPFPSLRKAEWQTIARV